MLTQFQEEDNLENMILGKVAKGTVAVGPTRLGESRAAPGTPSAEGGSGFVFQKQMKDGPTVSALALCSLFLLFFHIFL